MPLNANAQSRGGEVRNEKLNDWERAFVGMLGGSKRPITKDRRPTPEQLASELRQEGVKEPIPWSVFVAVGMNGGMVGSTLPKTEQVKTIRQLGDIAGFAGLIMFNKAWRTYTRRLLLDPMAQERLDTASGFFIQHVKEFQKEELERRGRDASNSVLSAQVYLDPGGRTVSMFYSFYPAQFPEPGSTRIGTVYVVNTQKASGHYQTLDGGSPWLVRFHFENPECERYVEIMKQATEQLSNVVKKLQEIQVSEV